jgi:hypothetical protein
MARGKSGRIVLEINPEIKKELYLSLEKNQLTLKEWFLKKADNYIKNSNQLKIFNE